MGISGLTDRCWLQAEVNGRSGEAQVGVNKGQKSVRSIEASGIPRGPRQVCGRSQGPESAGTDVIAGTAATEPVGRLQRQDLEGCQRSGTRLGGDHASEAGHRPCPNVVVVGTH